MTFIENFWNQHSDVAMELGYKILLTLALVFAAYLINSSAKKSINAAFKRVNNLDKTLLPVVRTTASIFIFLIALIVILDIFGVNTTSIVTLMGAAGLAVGLALKDTLGNIAAGIVILILRPFRVNHFVEFGGFSGTVKKVGLFATELESSEGLFISAPNSSVWQSPLINYTHNGRRRFSIDVGISYSDSIDKAFEVLNTLISEEQRVLGTPAPQIMVTAMADSSVNLQIRAWCTTTDYWQTYWDTTKAVKESLDRSGISIPFPQMDVHLNPNK